MWYGTMARCNEKGREKRQAVPKVHEQHQRDRAAHYAMRRPDFSVSKVDAANLDGQVPCSLIRSHCVCCSYDSILLLLLCRVLGGEKRNT